MSKIRITFVVTGLSTGGAEMMLLKLLSCIDRDKFAPSVLSLTDRGTMAEGIEALKIPVHAVGLKPGRIPVAGFWHLVKLLRKLQPDILQGWMYHGNLAAQLTASFVEGRPPVIWNIRGTHVDLSEEKRVTALTIWLSARLSHRPVRIINNSRNSVILHEQRLGFSTDRWAIIPNGFDAELFTPSIEARKALRAELGLPESSFLIGLVGRYHPIKDHSNFLQAATDLLKTHPNVNFILVGPGIDKSNSELMRLINKPDLGNSIYLLGQRDDLPYLTAALDISSSSSYGEGFPNVIGEAMSCGVPCVVTDVGDSAWVVGDTGKVVPPRDPVALANAWRELIDIGAEQRQALGMKARQRIIDKFSLETVVHQYESLYEQVIALKDKR